MTSTIDFWMITWVNHNCRVSKRMSSYLSEEFINELNCVIFNKEDQKVIVRNLIEGIRRYHILTVAFNVLPDHVHMLIALERDKDLSVVIGNLKGYSSTRFRKLSGFKGKIWAQKFNRRLIKDDRHLNLATAYIQNNHYKHLGRWGKNMLCAFDPDVRDMIDKACMGPREIILKGTMSVSKTEEERR